MGRGDLVRGEMPFVSASLAHAIGAETKRAAAFWRADWSWSRDQAPGEHSSAMEIVGW
jgi:hypothetical protein